MTNGAKHVEERLFYRLTSRAYEFLMLNIFYFVLTFFFYVGIVNTLWGIEAWLFFIPFIIINCLYFSALIRYFKEKKEEGYGVRPIKFLEQLRNQFFNGSRIGVIASLIYTILLIDALFILLHPSIYFLFALLAIITVMVTTWLLNLTTVDVYQSNLNFKKQAKLALLLSLKRWPDGLVNLFWLAILVLSMVYRVQLGFILMPSVIYFFIYKINDQAYRRTIEQINGGEI